MARRLPVLARHAGIWDGVYRHQGPDFAVLDQHWVRCWVEVPEHGAIAFRLTTRYWWPDGRTADHLFEGQDDGRGGLVFDDGRIHGWLREIDDETVVMRFAYSALPGRYVSELIQISACGQYRARSWHHYANGQVQKVTLTREVRAPTPLPDRPQLELS